MKIHIVGSINVDHFYFVRKIARSGQSIKVEKYKRYIGGKGTNQCRALQLASNNNEDKRINFSFCGKISNDPDGKWLLEELRKKRFPTNDIILVDDGINSTGHCIMQKEINFLENDAAVLYYLGTNGTFTEDDFDQILFDSDVILIQNEMNSATSLISKALLRSKRVMFNPSPVVLGLELPPVEWLIMNLWEFNCLFGNKIHNDHAGINGHVQDELEIRLRLAKKDSNIKNIIVTMGGDGSIAVDFSDNFIKVPPFKDSKYPIIDSIGAGDCYTGYLLCNIIQQELNNNTNGGSYDLKKAMEMASVAASIKIERQGAFDGIPVYYEVIDRMSL